MSVQPDVTDQRAHFVYRCYDAAGALLYIGCAADPAARIALHMAPSTQSSVSLELQGRMARHEATPYLTKAEARIAEVEAIRNEAPLLNRQHNIRRWRKVARGAWHPVEPAPA